MQIVMHVGAHCTDENRLAKCLARNRGPFLKRGISVPPPSNYRVLLREAIHALAKGPPAEDARDILVDEILEDDQADRVILSNDNFFGVPKMSMSQGQFYPMAEQRIADLRELFPRDDLEIFLAIRDPATFIPAVVRASTGDDLSSVLGGSDPSELRWSGLIRRIHGVAPNVPITVWCNEDTPLIWAQIIREMAMLEPGTKIKGGFDLLREIMTREGMQRFRAYLRTHPIMTERQKHRVIAAFLDKYAIDDAVEEELELPGWDEDVVEYLSDIYEEDVRKIERMPNVALIAP
jgi:hypothetical protein